MEELAIKEAVMGEFVDRRKDHTLRQRNKETAKVIMDTMESIRAESAFKFALLPE